MLSSGQDNEDRDVHEEEEGEIEHWSKEEWELWEFAGEDDVKTKNMRKMKRMSIMTMRRRSRKKEEDKDKGEGGASFSVWSVLLDHAMPA